MNRRILLLAVIVIAANSAHGAKYERTLDGKTKIWRIPSQRKLQASWSGERDDKGFATGRGTLTWFATTKKWETGSLLPATRYIEVSHYTGKMVEGKLEGPVVSVDSSGNTYHAKFADGRKTGDWIAGSGSLKKHPKESESPPKVVEAPAEAPPPAPKLDQHIAEKPISASSPAAPKETSVSIPAPETSAAEHSDDSVRSLAMPPSSLRVANLTEKTNSAADSSSPPPSQPEKIVETAPGPPDIPPARSAGPNDDDARMVATLDSEYQTAVKTNDASAIDHILADDFVLVRSAGRSLSKPDLIKQARDKQAKYEHHEVVEGTQKVRVWNDTAVVTETVWVKGTEEGQSIDQKMSVTATYARTPNGWRYVSGQTAGPAK